jgi:hypothetical protein
MLYDIVRLLPEVVAGAFRPDVYLWCLKKPLLASYLVVITVKTRYV